MAKQSITTEGLSKKVDGSAMNDEKNGASPNNCGNTNEVYNRKFQRQDCRLNKLEEKGKFKTG